MNGHDGMNGWRTHRIEELVDRVANPVEVTKEGDYQEIGVRSHGKGIFHKPPISGSELGNKRVYWVEPNCFVVNIVFAWEQAVARTTETERGMIASHRFPMYRPKANRLDLDYLLLFFKTPYGKHLLSLASPGGAGRNKTLGQEAFLGLSIPVPPLPEQRQIAAILGKWDEAIRLTADLIAAKQQRKKGLMQRLLSGEVRFPGFEGRGWWEVSIGTITDVTAGGTPNTNHSEFWKDGTIPWMRSGEVHKKRVYSVGETITRLGMESSNAKLIPPNSILIALAGQGKTRGTVAINKIELTTNQSIAAIIPDADQVYYEYLFYDLDSRYEELRRLSAGDGGRGGLNLALIKGLSLRLPSIEEQKKVAAILNACDQELALLQQKLAALQQQKKGLMQQLLTGRVRVRTSEA